MVQGWEHLLLSRECYLKGDEGYEEMRDSKCTESFKVSQVPYVMILLKLPSTQVGSFTLRGGVLKEAGYYLG